jgi:hypothetical protein
MAHDPGAVLRALHRPGDPFVLANAWDAGSARMLAALGAQAIGATSAGYAVTLGRPDMGRVTRDEALAHAKARVAAAPLPVSGDLENGYGDKPEDVAQTVRSAAEVGLAGCSIEDTALPGTDAYPRADAVERIRAAAATARAQARDFVLVARADGLMNGAYDLDEATARVRAFEAVGAVCVYVPAPGTIDQAVEMAGIDGETCQLEVGEAQARLGRAAGHRLSGRARAHHQAACHRQWQCRQGGDDRRDQGQRLQARRRQRGRCHCAPALGDRDPGRCAMTGPELLTPAAAVVDQRRQS